MADYIRYEKQVPFYGHWDVVVLGGGRPCACLEGGGGQRHSSARHPDV